MKYCNGDSPKYPTDRPFIQNNTGDPGLATFLLKRREECSKGDWETLCTERKFAVYSLYSEMLYDFFCHNWKSMEDCDISKYPERFCQSAFSIEDGSGFIERAPNYNLPGCSNTNSGMSWKMYNETKPGNWYFFSDQCNLFFDIMSVYFYILTVFIIISNGTLLIQYFFSSGQKSNHQRYKTSVAFADFIIGAFVLPLVLVQRYYAAKLQLGSTKSS